MAVISCHFGLGIKVKVKVFIHGAHSTVILNCHIILHMYRHGCPLTTDRPTDTESVPTDWLAG